MPQTLELQSVLSAVGTFEHLGEDVRTMLLSALPHAVATLAARHRFQQEFLALVQGVLQDGRAVSLDAKKGVMQEKTEAELQSAEAVQAIENAKVALVAAAEGVTAAAEKSAEAAGAAQKAEVQQKEMEQTTAGVLEKIKQLQDEQAKAGAVAEGSLRMLLEGGWDDEEVKTMAVEAVTGFLSEIKASVPVVAAAPHALGTKPQDRQAFDTVSVDAIKEIFDRQLATVEHKLREETPRKRKIEAEVLGLWAIADCAREEALAAKSALQMAKRGQESASIALEQEEGQVLKRETAALERDAKCARLETHIEQVEGALAAVTRLVSPPDHEATASTAAVRVGDEQPPQGVVVGGEGAGVAAGAVSSTS